MTTDGRFAACVAFTLAEEGGYVCNPADPGGATNMGITVAALSRYRGYACDADDVRALQRAEVEAIYEADYWGACGGPDLVAGMDVMVFDFGVNAGPETSVAMLQRIVGAHADGIVGPDTVRRAECSGTVLRTRISALGAAQEAYYLGLHNAEDQRGWLARTKRRQAAAMKMAAETLVTPAPAPIVRPVATVSTQQTIDDVTDALNAAQLKGNA